MCTYFLLRVLDVTCISVSWQPKIMISHLLRIGWSFIYLESYIGNTTFSISYLRIHKLLPLSLKIINLISPNIEQINCMFPSTYRPFGLGAFTAKSGRKHYNPPPLTVMWMNFDSPNFPSLCSLSAIISFQTCSNKCILYVLLFHKCIKIKYKTVNMFGVFLWLVQSSSRWNTIHSHRNYHVQLLGVRVGEFCHKARSR